MSATDLVKALLDGINLPGYDDDSEPDEFNETYSINLWPMYWREHADHPIPVKSTQTLSHSPEIKSRLQSTIEDWASLRRSVSQAKVAAVQVLPNEVVKSEGPYVLALFPDASYLVSEMVAIMVHVSRYDLDPMKFAWTPLSDYLANSKPSNEALTNLPGYGDDASSEDFAIKTAKILMTREITSLPSTRPGWERRLIKSTKDSLHWAWDLEPLDVKIVRSSVDGVRVRAVLDITVRGDKEDILDFAGDESITWLD